MISRPTPDAGILPAAPPEIFAPRAVDDWLPPEGEIVLLVAYSRFGQGHISRCLKIAAALRGCTSLEPVVICGNPEFLRSLPDLDFQALTLPPYLYQGDGAPTRTPGLQALASPLPDVPVERLSRYRGHLLRLVAERCRPAAVLIDHFPFSGAKSIEACGELVEHLGGEHPPIPVFSGFRGLLSERFLLEDGSHQRIMNALRSLETTFVFLDHDQRGEFFDRYEFLRPAESLLEFVGHVGPGDIPQDPPEPGLILATFGGGVDSFRRIEAVCEAFRILRRQRRELRLEVVTGRRLPSHLFDRLASSYADDATQVIRHVDRLPRRFSAADLLVCGAGYNTLVELFALARGKVVSIPRSRSPSSEQSRTAERFERLGGINYVLPESEIEPPLLAERLAAVLDAPSRSKVELDLRGAERTAHRIQEALAAAALG